jgi:hypothetical protein
VQQVDLGPVTAAGAQLTVTAKLVTGEFSKDLRVQEYVGLPSSPDPWVILVRQVQTFASDNSEKLIASHKAGA